MKSSLIQKWVVGVGYHRDNIGNFWSRWFHSRNFQFHSTPKRVKKKACDEWQTDYRKHSLEFGEIIHNMWSNSSTLASCQYRNGRFEYSQAIEPSVGLARAHLVLGYPEVWKLYRRAVAESTEMCNSISKLISSFEERIISTIETGPREYNLVRMSIGSSPKKCEDLHYYIDIHIFEAVFELVQDRLDGKSLRPLILENGTYIIGEISCPYTYLRMLNGLGSGSEAEMIELKTRVENLIDDPDIGSLIEQYNQRIANLQKSELKKSYHEAIDDLWTSIRDNGEMLGAAGSCENIKECRPRPPGC